MKITIEEINNLIGETPLNEHVARELISIIKVFKLKKYQAFLKKDEVCNHWGYVVNGLLRTCYYKDKKEITENFSSEGTVFMNVESYVNRTPSRLMMEALEPTLIYAFPYDDFEELCHENHEIEHWFRKILEKLLTGSQKRLDALQFENARKRYENFTREFPQLILRIPAIYIASYLGITQETLCRVRAR